MVHFFTGCAAGVESLFFNYLLIGLLKFFLLVLSGIVGHILEMLIQWLQL